MVLNRRGVTVLWPYLALGVALWYVVFRSGLHPTLAGVALAMTIPIRGAHGASPLEKLEHGLNRWVAFLVVPVFGFANAGVALGGPGVSFTDSVPLGIALGLLFGKQIGVFGTAFVVVKAGFASFPDRATWTQLYGVALLCGIGFTMSLFIGLLAFPGSQAMQDAVKLGVLTGSLASALVGAVVLRFAPFQQTPEVRAHQK
jgi:NhaA family Na+:H+ antiporter